MKDERGKRGKREGSDRKGGGERGVRIGKEGVREERVKREKQT